MFNLLRYIVILILLLAGLYWLDSKGVDIGGMVRTAGDNVKTFFQSIKDSPTLDRNSIFKDLNNQDFIGELGSSTATTTKKKLTEVKSEAVVSSNLSVSGIIKYTNAERVKYGLKPLTIQAKLSRSATNKVDDMLDRQYFEHVSPQGLSASDLVKDAGYVFELVGENLALGDFGTDKKLVEAWMNSPKHRANILNPKFTEIGVSAANGIYKGERQWLFVQHFGRPQPDCPKASVELKNQIDLEKESLQREENLLKKIASDIETNPSSVNQSFLDQYNTRVATYNNKLTALKEVVAMYNEQVNQYNTCLKENK